jgi:hypothetical protein
MFNTEIFTQKKIPELWGFSHSPLPLFVADEENTNPEISPKDFLNQHAVIIAPKPGQAYARDGKMMRDKEISF